MKQQKRLNVMRSRRKFRNRNHIRRSAHGLPRLSVFRSNNHTYAQIIDDTVGHTIAFASSQEGADKGKTAGTCEDAAAVGKTIAERAVEKGVTEVIFDRGLYQYHGRVAALAEAAREAGLKF